MQRPIRLILTTAFAGALALAHSSGCIVCIDGLMFYHYEGRVLRADTLEPLRGAKVLVSRFGTLDPGRLEPASTCEALLTDDLGRFTWGEVAGLWGFTTWVGFFPIMLLLCPTTPGKLEQVSVFVLDEGEIQKHDIKLTWKDQWRTGDATRYISLPDILVYTSEPP